jgi:hypothetical protein
VGVDVAELEIDAHWLFPPEIKVLGGGD